MLTAMRLRLRIVGISKKPLSYVTAPAKPGFPRDWQHSKTHIDPRMACGLQK